MEMTECEECELNGHVGPLEGTMGARWLFYAESSHGLIFDC